MFYLEIILEDNGGVKDVKIHHDGKSEPQVLFVILLVQQRHVCREMFRVFIYPLLKCLGFVCSCYKKKILFSKAPFKTFLYTSLV